MTRAAWASEFLAEMDKGASHFRDWSLPVSAA
jgi:hypothetical protein